MISFYDLLPNIKERLLIEKQAEIVRKMRKTLPATPYDDGVPPKKIIDIKMLADGTVRTYVENSDEPLRFYTPHEAVDIVASYKRLFSALIKNGVIGIITIVLNKKVWIEYLRKTFELYPIILKEEHWSQPVKEIRRILKIDETLKDAISLILENDMAYRYRMQAFLSELNQDNLKKNTIKELKRILDIFISRENDRNKVLWLKVRNLLWLLRFKGLNEIREILLDLKIDEIKFSKEDLYWIKLNKSFNWN